MTLKSTTWLMLFAAWLVMLMMDWFFPWFVLPDMVLLMWVALLFVWDDVPLWSPVLFVSVLMDVSANVGFGVHGLTYGICALAVLPIVRNMRLASGIEQLFVLFGISVIAIGFKGVLLYVVEGVPRSPGWALAIVFQVMLWPFARALAEWVLRPYMPQEDA